jgi:hypothetical protein
MSYTLSSLDGGCILLFTIHADFEIATELVKASREALDLFEQCPGPVVFITDTCALHINNLNDILQGGSAVRSPESMRLSKHPKLRKSISVIDNRVITLAAKGLNSATFGYVETTIFETTEDALDYARKLFAVERWHHGPNCCTAATSQHVEQRQVSVKLCGSA